MRTSSARSATTPPSPIIGPARRLDTDGGFVPWRLLALLAWIAAIWGLLTRLLRREEDTGRWELLLAGRAPRGRATHEMTMIKAPGGVCLAGRLARLVPTKRSVAPPRDDCA